MFQVPASQREVMGTESYGDSLRYLLPLIISACVTLGDLLKLNVPPCSQL